MSMAKLFKVAIENKADGNFSAGWVDNETRYVVTMCNGDTRNSNNKAFKLHVPVDRTIVDVFYRKASSMTEQEVSAAKAILDAISTIPQNSFTVVARIKKEHVNSLHNIGETAFNNKGYWELALAVGEFVNFTNLFADPSDLTPVVVLAYILPAFVFPSSKRNYLHSNMRTYTPPMWLPNFNSDETLVGWESNNTASVVDMAHSLASDIDETRQKLFERVEHDVDDALCVYKSWYIQRGELRSQEIIRIADSSKNSTDTPPLWWPKRLLDVRMNAVVPGTNAWYFRGTFDTLSYTWDTEGELFCSEKPWFSSQVVETQTNDAYVNFLQIAQNVGINEFLWIDALCIDQSNEAEKIEEVTRSPEYYRRCTKCIVMPAGLSRIPLTNELSSNTLPRWFHRAWTLQEAASAEFLLGIFKNEESMAYLDRYEMVSFLDTNVEQSGVTISSARRIMRRTSLDAEHPSTVLEWAVAREAGRIQDIIYGTISMLRTQNIPIEYNVCLRCVIFRLATNMQGEYRTSMTTLTGEGWLPGLMERDDVAGIVTESDLDSEILEDNSLMIRNTTLIKANEITFCNKKTNHNSQYRRYSQSKSIRFDIEDLAKEHSEQRDNRTVASDNAGIRAWIAVTYMSSDVVRVVHDKGAIVARVILLKKPAFSHLIFIGYARDSPYLEKVYLCTIIKNSVFYKVGIIAEPVGNILRDSSMSREDVVVADCSDCSCT